jgi:hypothetical protein
MPRPRRYESAAQRQAAYRERQRRRSLEDQLAAVPWPAAWRTELTAFARRHGVAAAREAEDLLQAQLDARPHEPVVELKLSLLDASRIDTASPGSWAISLDGERVLGGLADGPIDAADLVMQRSAQELRDLIDYDRLDDAAIAEVLRQALASNAAPLVAALLVAVGAWPLHHHQAEPRPSDDDS